MTTTITQTRAAGWYGEIGALLRLSVPIMVAQGGLTAMGLTDTFMIGQQLPGDRDPTVEMGGVALGNILTFVVLMFGLGLTMGIEPLVAQAHGAGESDRAYRWFQQGMWTAALASLPTMFLIWAATFLLPYMGIKASVVAATLPYVWFRLPSIPVNAMYGAARSYLTSVQRTRPVVIAVVVANVANVFMDAVFLHVLDMGAAGVGLATSICWLVMFLIAGYAAYLGRPADTPGVTFPNLTQLRGVFGLGWPIGLQMTAEVAIFALVGVLVAQMGEVPLGGHNIAINLASFTFMSAVGIAVASTTWVGFYVGANRSADARRIGLLSIAVGSVFMASAGLVFWQLGVPLARLFSPTDESVVAVGAELLKIAALFSISDGVQAVSAGALRGLGETKWAFYANAVGHWAIGLPVGLFLVHALGWGATGLWLGLTAGLTVVAVVLMYRFVQLTQGDIRRVE